jgi:integrase
MISVKYYLKDKRASRKSSIRASVCFQGKRLVFSVGASYNPVNWDYEMGRPKKIKGDERFAAVTSKLKELEVKIHKSYNELSDYGLLPVKPNKLLSKIFDTSTKDKPIKKEKPALTLAQFIHTFIRDCETGKRLTNKRLKMEYDTIKTFITTKNHFQKFEESYKKPIYLKDFNQAVHDDFVDYLEIELDHSRNSSSKHITNIRQVLLYAIKLNEYSKISFYDIKFETGREDSDNIYLTDDELKLMINLNNLSSELEENVKDLFIIGAYTGLRFSNYVSLDLGLINDGFIEVINIKTNIKNTIPILPEVEKIITKYKGQLPVAPTNQEFNRTLKDIAQRIPELHRPFEKRITKGREKHVIRKMKWEMVMTHTARRSFCTNMYLKGVPVPTIMAISGHRTEKNFYKYIKADGMEHARLMKRLLSEVTVGR